MPQKPNIVFFMVDQLSARWLEEGATKCVPTPNLDRLRNRSATFSKAYTSNPVCMPARATLATGLNSRQHGVLQNGYRLDPNLPTFMQMLQKDGYSTAAFGKVHLHPHFAGVHPDYREYGFDVTHITEDPRAGEWLDWFEQNHAEHFESALATIWCADIPELKSYGPEKRDLSSRIKTIRDEFDFATDDFPENTPQAYTLPFPEAISQTHWITDHALDFIRGAEPAEPLLAHISYVQPHGPSCPPAEYMDLVEPDLIPEPSAPEWPDDPLRPEAFDDLPPWKSARSIPENWRTRRHYYFADIAHLDYQLGKVMDALEETGRLGNTYIIFLADHGELLLEHGFTGKEEYHYDACIRIPLMISGPGVETGYRGEIVQLEDIFPTVLDMAGLERPSPPVLGPYLQDEPERFPGQSLLPICCEGAGGERDAAYSESYNSISNASPHHWARTICTDRYRYTMYPGDSGEQLFDLQEDPAEQHNLAGSSDHGDLRRELRDRLMDLIILQDYPHPTREMFAHGVH
ncbi:MAG: sulfatase [Candidatus Brocadiia bacterium]